jgi:amino acid adenylation domain-containing protein
MKGQKSMAKSNSKKIDKQDIEDILALTPIQEGMLFHYLSSKGSGYYNQQLTMQLSGTVSIPVLKKAWEFVAETNEMLRTVFRWEKLVHPVQIVLKDIQLPFEEYDFSGYPAEERLERLQKLREKDRTQGFDIEVHPLRITICKLDEGLYEMLVGWHHIIFDGWSNGILLKELFTAYNDFYSGIDPVKPVKCKYKDFIKWHKEQDKDLQREFWENYLAGFEEKTSLPCDNGSKPENSTMESHITKLPALQTRDLSYFTRRNQVTPASMLYSIWGILLQKYNNSKDVIFGTTVSGRVTGIKDVEEMVGLFINTVPVRVVSNRDESAADLIKRVDNDLQKRAEYENTPLIDIGPHCGVTGNENIFSSIVVMENYPLDSSIKNSGLIRIDKYCMYETTNYDLTLGITGTEELELDFSYDTGKFNKSTVERMSGHFKQILIQILNNPEIKLSEIDIITPEERKQILYEFNNPFQENFEREVVHRIFEKLVENRPENTAIIHNGRHYTYKEINERANRLAGELRNKGVGPDAPVALVIERSVQLIIAMLGVMKAGGVYIPIDHEYSSERIAYIIEDSTAKILITQRNLPDRDYNGTIIYTDDENSFTGETTNPVNINSPENLVYIIYTSGSTGNPKGVMVEHRNLLTYVRAFENEFHLTPEDVILQQAPCSFDHFVEELYPGLLHGGAVVIADKMDVLDMKKLLALIVNNNITLITCQPLLLNELNKQPLLQKVHSYLSGADVLKAEHISNLMQRGKVYNTYGPTEATVCAAYYRCRPEADLRSIPIGKPILNYKLYVLSCDNKLMPVGIPGEICISGYGVARGYYNNKELSEEKFVDDPLEPGSRMYRTGDVGRWLPDGNLEFIGRIDEQVKIRGFRIEPGEIEYHLLQHEAVAEAVVLPIDGPNGIKCIAAYIKPEMEVKARDLKDYLGDRLPNYMIPSYFYKIDGVPMTANSKADRKVLAESKIPLDNEEVILEEAASETEEKIRAIWKEVLMLESINLKDNFFDIGGNSILLMQMHAKLEKEFSCGSSIADLFIHTSVSRLAHFIDNKGKTQEEESISQKEVSGNDIAIIGISVKLPMADTAEEFWHNLRAGIDCVRDIPEARKKDTLSYLKYTGKTLDKFAFGQAAYIEDIDKFDYGFFKISPKEASLLDPNQRLFLQTAWNAIEDAGYGGRQLEGSKTGVYLGFGSDSDYKKMINEVEPEAASMSMAGNVRPIIASRLSYIMDLKGPSMIVDTTCSSSLVAVHLACQAIRNGECHMAVAGGIQLHLIPVRDFAVGIESSTGRARTFDDSSDGTGTGEGVIAMLLKPLSSAREDRDNIYAVIKSSAVNQDGSSIGITAPNAEAQENVIVDAWKKAGINPETITYIETHGTGTKLGDPIEIEGISRAFRRYTQKKQFCAVGSVKSNLGHLDNTAGIAGLLKAVLSLKHRELFPTLHFSKPNRKIFFEDSPVYITDRLQKWEIESGTRRCGVSAFGLSGTNCHMVLEEAPENEKAASSAEESPELFTLSAKSKEALKYLIRKYTEYLINHEDIDFRDLCYTANAGRGHYEYRLALLAKNTRELTEALKQGDYSGRIDGESPLHDLCRQYVKGGDINWKEYYSGEKRRRLSLPAYPFEGSRCWLNIPVPEGGSLYHTIVWGKAALTSKRKTDFRGTTVIFKDGRGLGDSLSQKLKVQEVKVIEAKDSDCQEIFSGADAGSITRIIHMVSLSDGKETKTPEELEIKLQKGVYSLFNLIKTIIRNNISNKLEIVLISDYAEPVVEGQKMVNPENSALFGLGKVAGWEYKNVRIRCIDIDDDTQPEFIGEEIQTETDEYKVAYRKGQRYVERIWDKELDDMAGNNIAVRNSGVYVITGGLGGIGLQTAKLLASKNKVNLAFINRTVFPKRAQWNQILKVNRDKKLCSKIKSILEIEKAGTNVYCYSADVSNRQQLESVLECIKIEHGKINGVFHGAGLGEGNLLSELTEADFKRIISPKIEGTWLLDHLTRQEGLDFFVLFSSAITLVGGVGSGPYTAANAYQDAFAGCRQGKTLTIDWPAWEDTGLSEGSAIEEDKEIFRVLPVEKALDSLYNVLNRDVSRVIVGELNSGGKIFELGDLLPFRLSGDFSMGKRASEEKKNTIPADTVRLKGNAASEYSEAEKKVAAAWRQVLGYEEFDVNDNFFEIGGDSILITRVHSLIEESFPGLTTISDMFSYPTIAKISGYISTLIGGQAGVQSQESLPLQGKKSCGDIAIIGIALKMPEADTLEQYWDNIRNKREFIREFPEQRQKDCEGFILNFTSLEKEEIRYNRGGYLSEVDKFDYDFFNLSPREASLMDPNQRLFLETAWEAIEDAGYGGGKLAGSSTGVYLGYADWPVYGQYISKKQPSMLSIATAGNTPSLMAGRISYLLDLKGPAFLVDTACSSSLVAVHLACTALKNGECDQALAGGVKVCLMPVAGVFEMGIESSDSRTRAFDDSSDGTVWGEGTAALLLKPMDTAMQDNDHIYAVIKGSAINQDGTSAGLTAPNAAAQEAVLVKAWQESGINPETITCMEAHGTGTRLGDPIEIDGIRRAFRRYTEKRQFCAISSVKTNIGHLESSSGVAGLLKAVAALKYKKLPPTINFSFPNKKIPFENTPVYVNDRLTDWNTKGFPRRCGVSSFGFSGTNCHMVLEEAPATDTCTSLKEGGYMALALSAKSRPALEALIKNFRDYIAVSKASAEDICYTADTGRGHYSHRLAIVAADRDDLYKKLEALCGDNPISVESPEYLVSEGIYYGEHRKITVQREAGAQGLTTDEVRGLKEAAGDIMEEILKLGVKSKTQLDALCGLYIKGADINWELLFAGDKRRKISLPCYPFQRSRCWIDIDTAEAEVVLKGRRDSNYTVLEKKLGNIWGQILGLKQINIYDDFFEIGGNSLLAIRMEVDLGKSNITISSDDIYTYSCIKDLAGYLETADHGKKKILENIEPFNELFYKTCFYNSLFPVLGYFGESILPVLMNDIIMYRCSSEGQSLDEGICYEPVRPLEMILEEADIGIDTGLESENIIIGIEKSISNDRPVILRVDSFYESIRKDTYMKKHLNHTLLIYGYDSSEQVFYIIEHDREENLSYKKCTIPYGDVVNAYTGYREYFADNEEDAVFCAFFRNGNPPPSHGIEEYGRILARNILNSRDKIAESMEALETFISRYNEITSSETALKDNVTALVSFLNDIINGKIVEKYRLSKLFDQQSDIMELLSLIITQWNEVRKTIARFMYLPVFNPEAFSKSVCIMNDILDNENCFNRLLAEKAVMLLNIPQKI